MNEVTCRFVHLFNEEQDFYECHEIFEEAWKESITDSDRLFYKALVQVATAQFKVKKGLLNGVRKLYNYATPALDQLPDTYNGIDIRTLQTEFANQLAVLPDLDVIEEQSYERFGITILFVPIARSNTSF